MTPEQIKQNPITVQHQKLDREEGATKVQEEFTTSEELTEEYSTFSDLSRQDSESNIITDDAQDEKNSHTPETLQIHNTYNTTMHDKDDLIHDEYDTSEDENITEIEIYEDYGEKIHETESQYLQKHLKFLLYSTKQYIMKMIHLMTNLRLKLNHQKRMGSKKLENRLKSLLPNFKWKLKTEKLKGS